MRLLYSVEASALGTAGALRNAAPLVTSKTVLAMNGDSYTDFDLGKLAGEDRDPPADAALVLVPADGRSDCGFVAVKPNGDVALFDEKDSSCRASYVNAGIYKFKVEMLYEIPAGREISLEKEMLPRWLNEGKHIRGIRPRRSVPGHRYSRALPGCSNCFGRCRSQITSSLQARVNDESDDYRSGRIYRRVSGETMHWKRAAAYWAWESMNRTANGNPRASNCAMCGKERG